MILIITIGLCYAFSSWLTAKNEAAKNSDSTLERDRRAADQLALETQLNARQRELEFRLNHENGMVADGYRQVKIRIDHSELAYEKDEYDNEMGVPQTVELFEEKLVWRKAGEADVPYQA